MLYHALNRLAPRSLWSVSISSLSCHYGFVNAFSRRFYRASLARALIYVYVSVSINRSVVRLSLLLCDLYRYITSLMAHDTASQQFEAYILHAMNNVQPISNLRAFVTQYHMGLPASRCHLIHLALIH